VNNSWVPVGPKETYTPQNWTPAENAWHPSGGGDDWTGPNNPVSCLLNASFFLFIKCIVL
jgi:hypothetical protein